MIDPSVLASQRRALSPVKEYARKGGRLPTCECGSCHRCRHRASMRKWRASLPKPPPKPMGPSMSLGRRCDCGQPISNTNRTGFCQYCHRYLTSPAAAERRLAA